MVSDYSETKEPIECCKRRRLQHNNVAKALKVSASVDVMSASSHTTPHRRHTGFAATKTPSADLSSARLSVDSETFILRCQISYGSGKAWILYEIH